MHWILSGGFFRRVIGYMLSQFYRAFLAVLTPTLQTELGAGPADLALSSGLWFIAFAAMQLPVGWGLERFGPKRTVSALLALGGGGGAAVFALAGAPWHLHLAMVMLGIGCAPIMVGSYYVLARALPVTVLSGAAGAVVGLGSLGNILGSAPLVWMIGQIGWRPTLWLLAAATLLVAALIELTVNDPEKPSHDQPRGSLRELLRVRELWMILPLLSVTYAASACVRGLWTGPYLAEVFGASDRLIGWVTLGMGLTMVTGNLMVGRVVRIFRSDKRTTVFVNTMLVVVLALLALLPDARLAFTAILLIILCFSDSSYSLIMAHGRNYLPQHLIGRGLTFLNMVTIAGVGVMQFASRPVYLVASESHPPGAAYGYVFLFFLIPQTIGLCCYIFSPRDHHACPATQRPDRGRLTQPEKAPVGRHRNRRAAAPAAGPNDRHHHHRPRPAARPAPYSAKPRRNPAPRPLAHLACPPQY